MTNVEVELQKLLAEREITRLLFAYHEAINRGRFEELGELFEHATYQTVYARTAEAHGDPAGRWRRPELADHGPPLRGAAAGALHRDERGGQRRRLAHHRRVVQLLHGVPGPPRLLRRHGGRLPLQAITAGRYEDTFEVIDDRWRFRSRQIRADLSGDLSRHMQMLPGDYRRLIEEPPGD